VGVCVELFNEYFEEGVAELGVAFAHAHFNVQGCDQLVGHLVLFELQINAALGLAHVFTVDHVEEDRNDCLVYLGNGNEGDQHKRIYHIWYELLFFIAC